MNKNKREIEKRETPIVDGDARPDMPLDPAQKEKKKDDKNAAPDDKFESERLSDMNSLEDYKDAK